IDMDSVGVNGLLAAIAAELGASLLLTPEQSDKARGSVRELATASKMMFLSRRRGSAPKDLGIDLLILKDKRFRETGYEREIEVGVEVLEPLDEGRFHMDEKGWFRILLGREEGKIVLLHHLTGEEERADLILKSARAEPLCIAAIERGLVSRLDHAAYLGRELGKAEIALSTGKTYIQDDPLFPEAH
ncbi:MAG: DUF4346 domain-containing protein, partial [Candidatus Bathyarchaeia archaeon]